MSVFFNFFLTLSPHPTFSSATRRDTDNHLKINATSSSLCTCRRVGFGAAENVGERSQVARLCGRRRTPSHHSGEGERQKRYARHSWRDIWQKRQRRCWRRLRHPPHGTVERRRREAGVVLDEKEEERWGECPRENGKSKRRREWRGERGGGKRVDGNDDDDDGDDDAFGNAVDDSRHRAKHGANRAQSGTRQG